MNRLHLAFLNVGQGDTTIIYDVDSGEAVVVDCVDYLQVMSFFENYGIRHLRALIITHAHADHYSGAIRLLDSLERQGITWDAIVFQWQMFRSPRELLSDGDHHSDFVGGGVQRKDIFRDLMVWASNKRNKSKHIDHPLLPKDSKIIKSITFCHPEFSDIQELYETGSLNNLSYVIRVEDGTTAMLMGDLEPAGWELLKDNHPDLLQNDVIKFPHHGVWRNGNINALLDEVRPFIIIVSVGSSNSYGHPSLDVFNEIRKRDQIRLLCTQATKYCCDELETPRESILQILQTEDIVSSLVNIQSRNGCPCAGTVIIELGDQARVIWPSIELHNHKIIDRFMKTHRCNM
jgi:competence protein ComEC